MNGKARNSKGYVSMTDEQVKEFLNTEKGQHKRALVKHVKKRRKIDGAWKPHGAPIATLVAFINEDELLFGYSKYNRKMENKQSSRLQAIKIAIYKSIVARKKGRATFSFNDGILRHPTKNVPSVVSKHAGKFLVRASRYFKRDFSNLSSADSAITPLPDEETPDFPDKGAT